MYRAVILLVCALVSSGLSSPIKNEDWSIIPDGNGNLRFVNLSPNDITSDLEPEPKFNAAQDMIFYLYTRKNMIQPQVVTLDNVATLMNSNFDVNHPTRFTIHGWNSGSDAGINQLIKDAYLQKGDFNCFVVDWTAGSNTVNYLMARSRVTAVGKVISRFINFLNKNTGVSWNNIYLIGHSLGAHIAGITGRQQKSRLNTIIGLEAASPLFSLESIDRLEPTDAQYVEAIHTNGGGLSFHEPLGDADFYPNGGSKQPGCGIDLTNECSHSRSWRYYAESIYSPTGFTSVRCQNYEALVNNNCVPSGLNQKMGGEPSNFNKGVEGIFTLTTRSKSPFALG